MFQAHLPQLQLRRKSSHIQSVEDEADSGRLRNVTRSLRRKGGSIWISVEAQTRLHPIQPCHFCKFTGFSWERNSIRILHSAPSSATLCPLLLIHTPSASYLHLKCRSSPKTLLQSFLPTTFGLLVITRPPLATGGQSLLDSVSFSYLKATAANYPK